MFLSTLFKSFTAHFHNEAMYTTNHSSLWHGQNCWKNDWQPYSTEDVHSVHRCIPPCEAQTQRKSAPVLHFTAHQNNTAATVFRDCLCSPFTSNINAYVNVSAEVKLRLQQSSSLYFSGILHTSAHCFFVCLCTNAVSHHPPPSLVCVMHRGKKASRLQ